MDWFVYVVIGFILGWLAELLIDWLFWKDRRVCREEEDKLRLALGNAETTNLGLQTELGDYRVRGQKLIEFESTLQTKEAHITKLEADFQGRELRLADWESALEATESTADTQETNLTLYSSKLSDRQRELDKLSADHDLKTQDLATLETKLKQREARISKISLNHQERGTELDAQAQLLNTREQELGGISAEFSSKKQYLVEWEARLKSRESGLGDSSAALATCQARVSTLEAQLDKATHELSISKKADTNTGGLGIAAAVGAVGAVGATVAGAFSGYTGPPMINDLSNNKTTGFIDITGHAKPNEMIELFVDQQSKGTTTVNTDGHWSLFVPISEKGSYTVHACSISPDGEELATSARHTLQLATAKPDDLKKIWGIGPALEKLLNRNNIYTFAQLANVSTERLDEILLQGGDRFRIAKHQTWRKQARLAAQGRWNELESAQDNMDWSGERRL